MLTDLPVSVECQRSLIALEGRSNWTYEMVQEILSESERRQPIKSGNLERLVTG